MDNEEWLRALGTDGPGRDRALEALRGVLRVGLSRAFGARVGDEVEDFVQEALLRVLADLPSFRGDSRFTSWALGVAMRIALSSVRRARWRDQSLEALLEARGTGPELGPSSVMAGPRTGADRELTRRRILRALDESIHRDLTERQRTVIVAELRGMPPDVLADRLGVSRNALYKLTFDGRRALARGLAQSGVAAEELAWAFEHPGPQGVT